MAIKNLGPSPKFHGRTLYFLENEADTYAFAAALAPFLKPGVIVKITGPLGAGKTTFTRALVHALGGDSGEVHSPTFSLVHEYIIPSGTINHCDFYRLREGSMLEEFGGLEFFDEPKIYIVEWFEHSGLLQQIDRRRLLELDLEIDSVGRKIHAPSTIKILN